MVHKNWLVKKSSFHCCLCENAFEMTTLWKLSYNANKSFVITLSSFAMTTLRRVRHCATTLLSIHYALLQWPIGRWYQTLCWDSLINTLSSFAVTTLRRVRHYATTLLSIHYALLQWPIGRWYRTLSWDSLINTLSSFAVTTLRMVIPCATILWLIYKALLQWLLWGWSDTVLRLFNHYT